MRNEPFYSIILILAIFFASIGGIFAQITLKGRIVDALGNGIRGASITFFDAAGTQQDDCSTNSRGEFSLATRAFVAGRQIRIEVRAEGFDDYKKDYTLRTGDFRTITLTPLFFIRGTVKSDEGFLLKDAMITVYDQSNPDKVIFNKPTDEKGAFESEKLFKKGQKLIISVSKPGFAEGTEEIEIKSREFETVHFVVDRRLFISGYVVDSVTRQPIQGADVFFFNRNDGRAIKTVKTNQSGYYDFDAPFTPGEVIRVRIEKNPDYAPVEKTLSIIKHEIAPPRLDFDFPKWEDRGLKIDFRIKNKKFKPIETAEIRWIDGRGQEQKKYTSVAGEALVTIRGYKPGTKIDFRVNKPGYREELFFHNMATQIEFKEVTLEKLNSCQCWLYAAIGLAAVSATGFVTGEISYKKHKEIKNLDFQDDYDQAKLKRRIGRVAGGLAIGAFTGWLICKSQEKKKNMKIEQKRKRMSATPWTPLDAPGIQIGVAFRF